jgi:hypothetical protein
MQFNRPLIIRQPNVVLTTATPFPDGGDALGDLSSTRIFSITTTKLTGYGGAHKIVCQRRGTVLVLRRRFVSDHL